MADVYPKCLEGAEQRLEENNPKEAVVLCRNCLESLLKNIVLIKKLEIKTKKIKFWKLNRKLFQKGIYDKYWHDAIKNLVDNIGNPAVHNEREILFEEAVRFVLHVKEFINVIYLPLFEDKKPDFLEEHDFQLVEEYLNDSRVITEREHIFSISTGRRVDYTQLKVEYKDISGQRKWEDAIKWWDESGKPVLILAEPGQGKTTLIKELFKQSKHNFFSKRSKFIPIICKLGDFTSFEFGIKWLSISTYGHLSEPFLHKKVDEGKVILFADGWDELSPKYRTEAERFLSDILKKNNQITITSRFIDHVPTLKLFLVDKEKEIELQVGEIRPLDYHQIIEFIRNRNPNIGDNDLKSFQKSFWLSDLKAIPLWLDLLASLPDFNPENELIEMDLLTHWVNQVRLRDEFVFNEISEVERLAYLTISLSLRPKVTKDYIKRKFNLTDQAFEGLFSVGWLVPSGFDKVEPKYDFIHFRLHEFLASRFISKNWQELEGDIFDREEGLLSQKDKELLLSYALLDLKYRNTPQHLLAERVYNIAGEPGWEQNEVIDYDRLRDPFLAGYLFQNLDLSEESYPWIEKLDYFLNQLFGLLNIEERRKLIFSYIPPQYAVRSFLCRIPLMALFDDNCGKIIKSMIHRLKLPTVIIDNILEILRDPQIIEDPEYEKLFFDILEKRSSLGKWEGFIIESLNDLIKKGSNHVYSAFSMLNEELKRNLLLEWAFHPDPEIRIYSARSIGWITRLLDKQRIIDIYEYWIEEENEEIRAEALKNLIDFPEYLTPSIVQKAMEFMAEREREKVFGIILETHSDFNPQLIVNFFFSLSEMKKIHFSHDKRFLKLIKLPEYSDLTNWFIKNAPLWIIIDFLSHFCSEDTGKDLIKIVEVTGSQEEIKECIDRLSFTNINEVHIAKILFSDFSEFLELFLLKHDIYNRFLRPPPSITLDELSIVLHDRIYFLNELKNELLDNKTFANIDEIIYQFLSNFKPPPKILVQAASYSYFTSEWLNIPILFDWFDEIVGINDNAILERYSRFLQENRNYLERNKSVQQKIHHLIIEKQVDTPKWFILYCSLLVESFDQRELKNNALESMRQHEDPLIRAISLRLSAEVSGVDIKSTMNKAYVSLRKKSIRPIIKERFGIDLDKEGIIGVISITEDGIQFPELINFGLLSTRYDRIIPSYKSLGYQLQFSRLLVPTHSKSFLALGAYTERSTKERNQKNIFQKWILDKSSAEKDNIKEINDSSWIITGLRDSCDEIKLAVMFYLEDLIFQNVRFNQSTEIVTDLKNLHGYENEIISSFSVFLHLLLVTQVEKSSIITSIKPTKLNLQAIVWALGSSTSDELDHSILHFIKKFDEKSLFDSLDIFNPWLIFYPKLFWHFWDLILKLNKEEISSHFFINKEPKLIYYLMQSVILTGQCLDMIFLTSEDLQFYEGVKTWLKYLNSKINLSRREITEFLLKVENHEEISLQLFVHYLKLSLKLDYNLLHQMISLDKPEYTDLRFLLMFHTQLDKIQLKKLYGLIFDSSFEDLKYQAIEVFRFFVIDEEIIYFLKIIFEWISKKHDNGILPPSLRDFFLFVNKCEVILLRKYFDETISELGSNIRYLISNTTDRDVLYRLLNYSESFESEEWARVYSYIYRILFPKVWYTYPKFWSDIMKEN